MSSEVIRFGSAAKLRAVAEPFLMRAEAHHNLILGLLGRMERVPDFYPSQPYFAAALRSGQTVCAAIMTPPFPVVVSRCDVDQALSLLANDVRAFRPDTAGVNAPVPVAGRFANAWQDLTGEAIGLRLAERVYKLQRVKFPAGISGRARMAREADKELLTAWRMQFTREAAPWEESSREAVQEMVERGFQAPPNIAGTFLWEADGEPVSMVGYSSPTPNSLRIAPVYTPPELRRKGYAAACTAAVSQHILDGGKAFVTLFTDLSNPTSNHIYQEVGFEPVCDAEVYSFGGR